MASGFVTRFKGKVEFDPACLWVGGIPIYGGGATQSVGQVASQSTVQLPAGGVSAINSATQVVFARLPAPPFANLEKTIQEVTLAATSSGYFVTLPAGVTFNGTTMNTIKSTVNGVISLVATSTINWAVTGFASTGVLTYSTST